MGNFARDTSRSLGWMLVGTLVATLAAGCPGPSVTSDGGGLDDVGGMHPDADRRDTGVDARPVDDAGSDADLGIDTGSGEDAGADAAADAGNDGGCVPRGPELCNGLDDDCDTAIDPGCVCPLHTPVPIGEGLDESIAARTDGSLLVAAQDFVAGSYTVQRYDASFAAVGTPITLTSDAARPPNDLVLFTMGSGYGAVFRQWPTSTVPSDDTWLARIDAATGALAGPTDLTPSDPAVGAYGAPFGGGAIVSRRASGPSLGVRILDASGTITAGPRSAAMDDVVYTAVASIETTAGVAFQVRSSTGPDQLRFARFDASASPVGASIPLDTLGGVIPSIAAQASGWGIVWSRGTSLDFAAVDATGAISVPALELGVGEYVGLSIAADGRGGWGVVRRSDSGTLFTYLDASGHRRGPDVELPGHFVTGRPSIAFDGTRFVVAVLGPHTALWVPCDAR